MRPGLFGADGRAFARVDESVVVEARGGLARITIEQRFVWDGTDAVDASLETTLPRAMELWSWNAEWRNARATGRVERWRIARERFEQAILEGKTAQLEATSENRQPIGRIEPGTEVTVRVEAWQTLGWSDGAWTFGWAFGKPTPASRSVPASRQGLTLRILEPTAEPASVVGGPAESHTSSEGTELRLAPRAPDSALEVRWRPVRRARTTVSVVLPHPGATHGQALGLLTIFPPDRPAPALDVTEVDGPEGRSHAVDAAILIDTSGSMKGSLRQVKVIVRAIAGALGPDDTVEVRGVGDDQDLAVERRAPEDESAMARALEAMSAAGFSSLREPLLNVLNPVRSNAIRHVIVLTDGHVGDEPNLLSDVALHIHPSTRVSVVAFGPGANRSFTAPLARIGRGVEFVVRGDEPLDEILSSLRAAVVAPYAVGVSLEGSALVEHAPQRLPDVGERAPALVGLRLRPQGGALVVRGRGVDGPWEERFEITADTAGEFAFDIAGHLGRGLVEDLDARVLSGGDRAFERTLERTGVDYRLRTRLTRWTAVLETTREGEASTRERLVVDGPGDFVSIEVLGVRAPRLIEGAIDSEEDTRITAVHDRPPTGVAGGGGDCLIAIYNKEPTLLGRRFVLDPLSPTRIGRGSENTIVLESDAVSRRHARIEARGGRWWCIDERSTNGTFVNDRLVEGETTLANGDRIKVGRAIFKYLSGADVEARYHEEIYRLTIIDGLTEAHVKRYLLEALDAELARARRHSRDLAILMFDIDHFKRINDVHGHLAGDHVLKELARIVMAELRRGDVFGRYGGEEFVLVLPETNVDGARELGEKIRERVAQATFKFLGDEIKATISIGVGSLNDKDTSALELIRVADEKLYDAKRGGRNRVVV